jgi:hypothetical protein
MATVNQQLEELRAELAELRQAMELKDALLDHLEDRAFAAGRASILGGREAPRRTRSRHLQAVDGGAS